MPLEAPARQDNEQLTVDLVADPLLAATRLTEAGLTETHVLYERDGEFAVALGAVARITVTRSQISLVAGGLRRSQPWRRTPLEDIGELLAEVPLAGWRAYGWAGFEFAYAHAGLLDQVGEEPLLHLVIPAVEARLSAGAATVRGTDPALLRKVADLLAQPMTEPAYQPVPVELGEAGATQYRAAVAGAIEEIRQGRLQKVILSRVVPVAQPVDLAGTYLVGRRGNTPARSFLLDLGDIRAAGFSPETVLEVDANGRVTTQPLAGTRALTGSAEEDRRLEADLLQDSKEIYEHAISVKVAHDELAELCRPGSVEVHGFMSVKKRGSAQHLASTVTGELPAGEGPWGAFAALFPAVTSSGVPKRAAYETIARHEAQPRGLYSGAVFYADSDGTLDAALVLRTVFQRAGQTWLRAGAGIIEQSDPDRELEETCEKLRSVAPHLVRGN
ncbi:salicylate synthase [Crossiella sp. SN42]|uniref:salicylate synthase n=1 Tax=Crossiella sp. SN42 TaxID=2944808 RepID=UPI00207C62D9|nr:salicylate synthase [Crossiella sp. SN42]MCO1581449.1 salicylate synthase [Crossiella sp. SN42]